MGKEICELCGCNSEYGILEKHHIVPVEITKPAGFLEARVVKICRNCLQELNRWNKLKVRDTVYDAKIKRFRAKSPLEMTREYEISYRMFTEYKKRQIEGLSSGYIFHSTRR